MNTKQPTLYILASQRNGTIYVGITTNLTQRIFQHKNGLIDGFSKRYHCKTLVYYEYFETMFDAITQEKKVKAKSRKYRTDLIESKNFSWQDLAEKL